MAHYKDMHLIMRLLINVLALIIVEYLVPGFYLANAWSAIVAAVVIGLVNTLIKPLIQFIALPLSIMTFGIAAFLINVSLLLIVSKIVPGFLISNFTTAIIASLVLSLVSWFLNKLARE
jgi:putative membrane protein